MAHYAYLNGRFLAHKSAKVHIDDRGFLFADGIYEVIACINGDLADERGHLDRLERSLKEIHMDMPVPRHSLKKIISKILKKNRFDNASVYIQVTRGSTKRDFKFPDASKVVQTLLLTSWPIDFDANALTPTRVITTPDLRWKRRDIKTVGLLAQSMAKQKAVDAGADDAWMMDDDGFITEGSSNNAWIIKNGVLYTRPATQDILKGVTRTAIIKIAKTLGHKVIEKSFTVADAQKADEAFSTSATALIAPVTSIDGQEVADGKAGEITCMLYNEYRAYVAGERGPQLPWKE